MILGITGTNGAGKGAVVEYLVSQKNFTHYSVRDLIVEEVLNRGIELNRTNIGNTGTDMRAKNSPPYFVETLLARANDRKSERVVIESIRTVEEAKFLQKEGGQILAIDAPLPVRFKRIIERGTSTDNVTLEEFRAQEDSEYTSKDPNDPNQMSVLAVMKEADFIVNNDDSLEKLHAKIESVLENYIS